MDVTKFEELQLDDRIIRAITEMGFEEASPIQAQAIPVVLEGRDMIRKDRCFRTSSVTEGRPEGKEASGHCPASNQRAGNPGS